MVVDDVAFVVVESVVVVVVKVGGKMLGLVVWCKKKNVKPQVLEQAKVLALASVVVVVVVLFLVQL